MSWEDRVYPTVELSGPNGETFNPKWRKSERDAEKTIGIFRYPKVNGAVTQDLGISNNHAFAVLFDGPDHDIEAERFMRAMETPGVWSVVLPVKGPLRLQPTKLKETADPVTTGGYTVIETEWIEALELTGLPGVVQQLASATASQYTRLATVLADQLESRVVLGNPWRVNAIRSSLSTAQSAVEDALTPLIESSPEAMAAFSATKRAVADNDARGFDMRRLAGEIRNMVRAPAAFGLGTLTEKMNAYTTLVRTLSDIPELAIDEVGRNYLLVRETFLGATNATLALLAVTGVLSSRTEAVAKAVQVSDAFTTMTDALDGNQTDFEDERLDRQYFSQSVTFSESVLITAQAAAYLLRASYDLPLEKRIVLRRWRAPIEIAITEQGSDSFLDAIISNNGLKGDDILVLPPGREVVLYV